jgi:hypothetical protein
VKKEIRKLITKMHFANNIKKYPQTLDTFFSNIFLIAQNYFFNMRILQSSAAIHQVQLTINRR